MLRALARKEIREVAPLIALAVIAQLYLVCTATGLSLAILTRSPETIPFVNDSLFDMVFLVAGALAVILGLWQTWMESARGTFVFLLHRPAERRAIFAAKLLLGAAASLGIALLPVVLYSLWAARPGTHASPFDWSMTTPAWEQALTIVLIYFGAFLSGLRPGRWFGSRLLPLVTAIVMVLWGYAMFSTLAAQLVWTLASAAVYVAVIFYVAATRDFS